MVTHSGMAETVADLRSQMETWASAKIDPLQEELLRMSASLSEAMAEGREERRRALASRTLDGPVLVPDGPYQGMHRFDVQVMQRMVLAQLRDTREVQDVGALHRWRDTVEAALSTGGTGTGSEVVDSQVAANLWEDVNLETAVFSLIPNVMMPADDYVLPLALGDIGWYPTAENANATQTNLATARETLSAKELVGEVDWSYTLDEDAVVPMLPELRATVVRNASEVIDDVVLNADQTLTSAGNINWRGTTVTGSLAGLAQYTLGFDGLLHLPLVDNTAQSVDENGALAEASLLTLRARLDRYGVRPSEVAIVCDVGSYIRLLGLDSVATLDVFGPMATVLTGQLGAWQGIPVIVSEQMAKTNASGVVSSTAANNTKGRVLMFNRRMWRTGFRRRIMVEMDRDVRARTNIMVISFRLALTARGARSSAQHTGVLYDITV